MPCVDVAFHEPIRLFKREEVEHQVTERRGVSDPFVQDACIARRKHAVRSVRKVGDQIHHSIAQAFDAQAVGE